MRTGRLLRAALVIILVVSVAAACGPGAEAQRPGPSPAPSPARAARTGGKKMTREDAVRLTKAVFKAIGVDSPGLNEKGLGGVMVGPAQIYFEYQAEPPAFFVRAHVHNFHKEPEPPLLKALQAEGAKPEQAGGGRVEYMRENRALFLTRTYEQPVEDAVFLREVGALGDASLVWSRDVLPRAIEASRAKPTPSH